MITWSVIANIVHQRVAEPALDQLNRAEKAVSILKQLKKFGIQPDPPQDFDGCYVHTLVEYGIYAKEKYEQKSSKPLLAFFTHEEIRQAFEKWFNDKDTNRAIFDQAAEKFMYWNKIGDELRDVALDPRQEFETFADIFNQHVDRTRAAFQARLEGKVDLIVADLEDLPQSVVAAIKKEIMSGLQQSKVVISDDGLPISDENRLAPPLKQFNPQFLEGLYEPSGAVKLRDQFYIERDADAFLKHQVTTWGSMTTIRAPRQTGKSSLLIRGSHYARQKGLKVVRIDLQGLEKSRLQSQERFLHYLAKSMGRKLRLDSSKIKEAWQSSWGPQNKLTFFMEDYILPESGERLVLMIDEADRLLETDFHSDFFGLMRTWYNNAAAGDVWEKLNICLVISSEPLLLISAESQSPFNVGLRLNLRDFNEAQVRDLNQRHGSPLPEKDIPALMTRLNGHPYLTRKALYDMVINGLSWSDLMRVATTNNGPFNEHLSYHYRLLHDKPHLIKALKQVMRGDLPDENLLYRLSSAGLVKGSADHYTLRCELYRSYFRDKFS